MTIDPRTPVIVGVAQSLRKPAAGDVAAMSEPADMIADALRRAGEDSGTSDRLLAAADSVRIVDFLSWNYANAAALVAERVGASPRETVQTSTGGNSPQMLLNDTCTAIQAGQLDVALIGGAEAIYTRLLSRKTKAWLEWSTQPEGTAPPRRLGIDKPGNNDIEQARGIVMPTQVYPMFENAIRAAAGRSIDDHQVVLSELWARFTEVAAGNPYAWSPEKRSAEEIRTVTPDNRMIGFPYPKLMNSNIQTDQAAALIVCSVQAALDAGVPEDRWVFPHAGADGHDHWFVSDRWDLHSSPAIRANGRAAFELTGIGVDDIAHVDLYSCFPSAVEIGATELGFGLDEPDRPLTVTGGLCFAGGPGNNYVTHSIAAMVEVLRADPGSFGLVTANGWYVTKHSVGVYSTTPPVAGFRARTVQAEVDATPRRDTVAQHDGDVAIETYTVMHERDGSPQTGLISCLLADGRRAWGTSSDTDLLKAMTEREFCGRPAYLRGDGVVDVA